MPGSDSHEWVRGLTASSSRIGVPKNSGAVNLVAYLDHNEKMMKDINPKPAR